MDQQTAKEIGKIRQQTIALQAMVASLMFAQTRDDPSFVDRMVPALLGYAEKVGNAGTSEFTKTIESTLSLAESLAQSLRGGSE